LDEGRLESFDVMTDFVMKLKKVMRGIDLGESGN
jgi:hypothetical protein